jgi:hypothetical protein
VKVEVYLSTPISPQGLGVLTGKGTSLMVENVDIFRFPVKELN